MEADGFLTNLPILDPSSPYRFIRVEGNPNLQAENMMAYELGYRAQPDERFSYDIALFYNVYENLIVGVPEGFFIDPYGNPTLLLGCTNMARRRAMAPSCPHNIRCRRVGVSRGLIPICTWKSLHRQIS